MTLTVEEAGDGEHTALAVVDDRCRHQVSYVQRSCKKFYSHRDLFSHQKWVISFSAASAGKKLRVLVLFCSAKTALNASAILDQVASASGKDQLPTILQRFHSSISDVCKIDVNM